jgi:hypothetical protein
MVFKDLFPKRATTLLSGAGLICLASLISGCDQSSSSGTYIPEPANVSQNPRNAALLSVSRKAMGENYNFMDEHITTDPSTGATMVCGKFSRPEAPTKIVYFTFTLEKRRTFGTTEMIAWSELCGAQK